MTPLQKVKEFHEATESAVNAEWTRELRDLRRDLIYEEFIEVEDEFHYFDVQEGGSKERLTKELADILYVVYGTAVALGLPLEEVFDRVHESNMSKLVNGKALFRKDGKVLKGLNYRPPSLGDLFDE